MNEVLAFVHKNNAELMEACHRLGYLGDDAEVWDSTYGMGAFWNNYRPALLIASDIDPAKSPVGYSVDFTNTHWRDRQFKYVVNDGPYKLNGTERVFVEGDRFGVSESVKWQDRMDLLRRGVIECCRCSDEWVLVKCKDQVVSGKKRWQTIWLTESAESSGFRLYDQLFVESYIPQPEGTAQKHARVNVSVVLVFRRDANGWRPRVSGSI